MSRYCGNGEECRVCGLNYGRFRTGLTYQDVWLFYWTPQDAPREEWKHKTRGVVLGKWFETKQQMWTQHKEECEAQERFAKGESTDADDEDLCGGF